MSKEKNYQNSRPLANHVDRLRTQDHWDRKPCYCSACILSKIKALSIFCSVLNLYLILCWHSFIRAGLCCSNSSSVWTSRWSWAVRRRWRGRWTCTGATWPSATRRSSSSPSSRGWWRWRPAWPSGSGGGCLTSSPTCTRRCCRLVNACETRTSGAGRSAYRDEHLKRCMLRDHQSQSWLILITDSTSLPHSISENWDGWTWRWLKKKKSPKEL